EAGRPTPVRVGLYDASGRMPLPSEGALPIGHYDDRTKQVFLRRTHGTVPPWPHENRWFFYIDGQYETRLPAGRYTLVISKGPEYRVALTTIDVGADETSDVAIPLSRWTDMPARGWYSGDDHVHMSRTPNDNATIGAIMAAEDVHVTNLLQMGNPYDTHFGQYAFGPDGRYVDGRRALVPGVEDPRTAVRGHTISLNIGEVYRPAERYLRYDEIFAEYRRQGGMSGFAHVAGRLFNVERGLAIEVPLGSVDFVEVLQDGVLETELWYDFLNLGLRLIPTAGSDFPYLSAPGGERNYVYTGDDFTVDAWYAALRAQETFVTNGPMLTLSVNGHGMGETLQVGPGVEISVEASAALNPDIEALARLELIVQGDVVAVAEDVAGDNTLSLSWSAPVNAGTWIAVRARGAAQTVAHSAPVYITTGGGFEKASAVPEIARRMIAKLAEFESVEADATQELEAWSVGEPLGRMLREQRVAILERADKARAVYARMLDRP
ncbi:MAG: CehA/McbA family metallohydrolase, partial [Gammaproteobacteria bacterium]|nr:CehA/McbA family metallohydrolase [Gammaproteobacteria bacterium]